MFPLLCPVLKPSGKLETPTLYIANSTVHLYFYPLSRYLLQENIQPRQPVYAFTAELPAVIGLAPIGPPLGPGSDWLLT